MHAKNNEFWEITLTNLIIEDCPTAAHELDCNVKGMEAFQLLQILMMAGTIFWIITYPLAVFRVDTAVCNDIHGPHFLRDPMTAQ